MRSLVLSATVLIAASAGALAQPNTHGHNTALTADDPADTVPSDYLRAAQDALAAGHAEAAQADLEMAQTRLLDRSVPLGQTNDPSHNPAVGQISQARQALAAHDRIACMQLIQAAIGSATSQGL